MHHAPGITNLFNDMTVAENGQKCLFCPICISKIFYLDCHKQTLFKLSQCGCLVFCPRICSRPWETRSRIVGRGQIFLDQSDEQRCTGDDVVIVEIEAAIM